MEWDGVAGRKGEYLFRRHDSVNWCVRFVYPPHLHHVMGKKLEFSLGTADRREAEIAALEHIKAHRLLLLTSAKIRGDGFKETRGYRYAPGKTHDLPEGGKVVATADQCIFLDPTGAVVKIEPNSEQTRMTLTLTKREAEDAGLSAPAPKPKPKSVDNDLRILQTYLGLKTRNRYYEREARDTWDLFKRLAGGKLIRDCTRDDARMLVAYLQTKDRPDKNATIVKKLNYLSAPVNYAIKEGLLTFNPFASVAPQDNDAARRYPFTDSEMATVAAALLAMDSEARRLWVLLATTGMRLGEAFQITSEETEKGIRKVLVGSKTEQSRRWIPIPQDALPFLPSKITGPLFESNAKNLGRVLLRIIDKLGVKGEGKVLHSLRHRAKDRLRAEGCPMALQYELLGHEEKTVAAGYGVGSPMTVLKPWLDKIGLGLEYIPRTMVGDEAAARGAPAAVRVSI